MIKSTYKSRAWFECIFCANTAYHHLCSSRHSFGTTFFQQQRLLLLFLGNPFFWLELGWRWSSGVDCGFLTKRDLTNFTVHQNIQMTVEPEVEVILKFVSYLCFYLCSFFASLFMEIEWLFLLFLCLMLIAYCVSCWLFLVFVVGCFLCLWFIVFLVFIAGSRVYSWK